MSLKIRESCSYLSLCDTEAGGELCPLGEGEVLGALEAALQLLDLEAGVDGAGLADFLALAVDPCNELAVLHYAVS